MQKETDAERQARKERQRGELIKLMKARENRVAKEGKKERGLTWREKFGFFRVIWLFSLGLICGVSWTYVVLELPEILEPKVITVISEVEAKEVDKIKEVEEIEEVIPEDNIAELAEMVYNLESSSGKNNYSKCEEIGKINGIGYGIPGNGKYQCFDSHEDEMQVLKGWIIDKKAKGMSDNELLCLYSGSNYEICK